MTRSTLQGLILASVVLGSVGCVYYEVLDPDTGKRYYTTNWDETRHEYSGNYEFRDHKSGARVVLDSSEVHQIDEDEFKAAIGKSD